MDADEFDVVVVGAGAAGLNAGLVLLHDVQEPDQVEFEHVAGAEQVRDDAAHHRADQAQQKGRQEPQVLPTRFQQPGQGADDEPGDACRPSR